MTKKGEQSRKYSSVIINLPGAYKRLFDEVREKLEERNLENSPAISYLASQIALHQTLQKLMLDGQMANTKDREHRKDKRKNVKEAAENLQSIFPKKCYDFLNHSKVIKDMLSSYVQLTEIRQREAARMKNFVDNCIVLIKDALPSDRIVRDRVENGLADLITRTLG